MRSASRKVVNMGTIDNKSRVFSRIWLPTLVILIQAALVLYIILQTSFYISNLMAARAPFSAFVRVVASPLILTAGFCVEVFTFIKRRHVSGWLLALVSGLVVASLVWNGVIAPF